MANQQIRKCLSQLIQSHFSQSIINRHVVCAIGYGSGVFPQTSNNAQAKDSSKIGSPSSNQQPKQLHTGNTIDLMMIVNNSNNFHVDLHRYRPNDYAGLSRYLGSSYLNMVNKLVYPVHFNHVQVNNTKVKYAVIDIDTFVHDLTTWKMLTFAGRMHKPVAYNILNTPQPEKLIRSVSNNHRMALNVGLLSMIGRIRDNQAMPIEVLYRHISNISYAGDIRYTMAVQNVNKVDNIVRNNIEEFNQIYLPFIRQLESQLPKNTITLLPNNSIKIRYTPQLISKFFNYSKTQQSNHKGKPKLPVVLQQHFQNMYSVGANSSYKNMGDKILINGISEVPKQINNRLAKINRNSSIKMAMQNFLSASLINNIKYLLAKIKKKSLR